MISRKKIINDTQLISVLNFIFYCFLEEYVVSGMTGFLSILSSLPLQKLTQNENEDQNDVREQITEDEDEGRKPDEVSSALLSKERCLELLVKEILLKKKKRTNLEIYVLTIKLIIFISFVVTEVHDNGIFRF